MNLAHFNPNFLRNLQILPSIIYPLISLKIGGKICQKSKRLGVKFTKKKKLGVKSAIKPKKNKKLDLVSISILYDSNPRSSLQDSSHIE